MSEWHKTETFDLGPVSPYLTLMSDGARKYGPFSVITISSTEWSFGLTVVSLAYKCCSKYREN